jgi:CubicO group peptidase (beta-lactamase class C family)
MDAENTPGLVLALTDRVKLLHVATYGYANVEARVPMTARTLLETGSIGKSFTAIALLQLHDEGRVDLHAPVSAYLPWFAVQTRHAPITIHHLLSHTSGLIFGSDFAPDARYEVWALRETETGAPPGEYYHYSNVGYKALGLILERLEGRPYAEIIRARVLAPLAMEDSVATITNETRARLATPYARRYDDRPSHPGHGNVPATWLETNTGDGCLASSVVDLAAYLRMFLNRGQGVRGRVLSERAFDLMTQQVIQSDSGAITSYYGYGVKTSELNDSRVLHHTGGMVGYSSAMIGDLDAGLGAVAIVNGPGQPRDIAGYGLELLQARFHNRQLPDPPARDEPARVDNAADYAGTYLAQDGRRLHLVAGGEQPLLEHDGKRLALERRGEDCFFVPHSDFARYLLQFGRAKYGGVVEAMHGPAWFANERYAGPTAFDYPPEWDTFPGHYRTHNPWFTNLRVVLRKGQLRLVYPSGTDEPLAPLDDGSFRVSDDARSPERMRFDTIVDGQALRLRHAGESYYRFFTD